VSIDIPTAISPRELRLLQHFARDRAVVEFGALLGFSTVGLAQVTGRLSSIDRHDFYSGPTARQFRSNLERYGVSEKVKVIEGDALLHGQTAGDVAFIDLTGNYQITKDLLGILGCRLALVHDFDRPNCDVGRAIVDAGWRPIDQVDTLLLCERSH